MTSEGSKREVGAAVHHLPCELTIDAASLEPIVERIVRSLSSPPASRWMTLKEASEFLRWPKHRLYKLTAARAIPHIKHEGRLLFNRDELDRWLDQHHEGPRLPNIV